MKLFKKFAVAVLFVSALALPTFAGDLETPGKTSTTTGGSVSTTTTSETTVPAGDTSTTTDESYQLVYDGFMAVLGLY